MHMRTAAQRLKTYFTSIELTSIAKGYISTFYFLGGGEQVSLWSDGKSWATDGIFR